MQLFESEIYRVFFKHVASESTVDNAVIRFAMMENGGRYWHVPENWQQKETVSFRRIFAGVSRAGPWERDSAQSLVINIAIGIWIYISNVCAYINWGNADCMQLFHTANGWIAHTKRYLWLRVMSVCIVNIGCGKLFAISLRWWPSPIARLSLG